MDRSLDRPAQPGLSLAVGADLEDLEAALRGLAGFDQLEHDDYTPTISVNKSHLPAPV